MALSTPYSVLQFLKRNSFKNKTGCYAIAICRRNFVNRADLKKTCPRFLNKEQLRAKIKSISVKLKKLWLICAKIIFCPTCILVDDRCGGTTLNCRNWLNIDSNDLMFFQKIDNWFFAFPFGALFPCTISCSVVFNVDVATLYTLYLVRKFLMINSFKNKPAAKLLQFAGKILQTERIWRKLSLIFK